MTQEEKSLLLQDLCARLPYGVYVLVHDTFEYSTIPYENVYLKSFDVSSLIDSISLNERYNSKDKQFNRIIKEHKGFLVFKPYLRPMSSMTEEEKKEYNSHLSGIITGIDAANFMIWVYKHHLDIFHFVEKGLALEAPEGMYK